MAIWLFSFAFIGSIFVGCATLPDKGASRGLYIDIRKAIDFRETSVDWVVDDLEISQTLPGVMASVCVTPEADRRELELWIQNQLRLGGGSARERFDRNQGMNGEVEEALALERSLAMLRQGDLIAQSKCPFWLAEDEDFRGKESDESRFVIFGETIGGGTLSVTGSDVRVGGGGGLRALFGGGVGKRFTLVGGLELGGGGTFTEEMGGSSLRGNFGIALPLLFRMGQVGSTAQFLDFEIAAVSDVTDQGLQDPGIRGGIAFGLSTPRLANLMPYLALWIGYAIRPPFEGRNETTHQIIVGTRAGFDWDPTK